MNKKQKFELIEIISNKTSGSSEIAANLNSFFTDQKNQIGIFKESIPIIKSKLNHFPVVLNYLEEISKFINTNDLNALNKFLINYKSREQKKYAAISESILKGYPKVDSILTISKSGTMLNVLLEINKKRRINVTVLESRPAFEGRLFAKSLAEKNINVVLVVDSMMATVAAKADVIMVGADNVLKNGNVVNKVGSIALAVLAKHSGKPFLVVTTKSKYTSENEFTAELKPESEVWGYKHRKIKILNKYFEEIESELITNIITERD